MGRGRGVLKTEREAAAAASPVDTPAPRLFFTINSCPLGFMLVAASGKGLCAVRFDESRETLMAGLESDFPDTLLEEDATRTAAYVDPLLRYLNGDQQVKLAELALDLKATDFQWKVWNILRALPPGETVSYTQLAELAGDKKAVRAVGRANATNPVAVVIPCHRVIGGDGSLTGYRWGVERKRQLLQLERTEQAPKGRLF